MGGQGRQGGEIVSHTHLCVSSWQDAVKSQTGTDAEVGDQASKMSLVNYKSVNC